MIPNPSLSSATVGNSLVAFEPGRVEKYNAGPIEKIAEALRESDCREYRNNLWDCPTCGEEKQSSLIVTDEGHVIPHCFRGCGADTVLEELGLRWSDTRSWGSIDEILDDKMFQYVLGRTVDLTNRQMDWYNQQVAREVIRHHIKEEARNQFQSRNNPYPATLSDDALDKQPDGRWLIDGVLELGVVAFLVGFTGSCKSFLGIDWAMSVASGRSWMGSHVEQAPAIYVAAEGGPGYKKRSRAWKMKHHKSTVDQMHWKTQPVQIMSDLHFEGLLADVKSTGARLVVIDTLSRCFVGYDQIDTTDTGKLFERLQKIRDAIEPNGTTVIVVHHTGWADKTRSRGSSDFKSSTDAEYVMELADENDIFAGIKLSCTKLKDEESWGSVNLAPEKIEVGEDAKGHMKTSLVLVNGPAELIMHQKSDDPRKQDQAWRQNFLRDHDFEDRPYSLTEIMEIMNAHRAVHQKVSDETLRRDLKQLGWNRSSGARNATLYQRP